MRGDKVAPIKPTILTCLIKVGGALAKKKCQKFTFGSDGEAEAAGSWHEGSASRSISVCRQFSVDATRNVFESDYTQQKRENAHREM